MFIINLNFVLEKDLQNVEELLTAIARNEGRKKIFPQILKKIGREDLQRKISQHFLYKSRGLYGFYILFIHFLSKKYPYLKDEILPLE